MECPNDTLLYCSLAIMVVFLVWSVVLAVIFILRREYFPIKQRSPYLTAALLGCYFIGSTRDPGVALQQYILDKPATPLVINMIGSFGQIGFCLIALLKTARTSYALHSTKPTQRWQKFFKNQGLLLLVGVTLACVVTVLAYLQNILLEGSVTEIPFVFKWVLISVLLTSQCVYLSGFFLLRNLHTKYTLGREYIALFSYDLVLTSVLATNQFEGDDPCLGLYTCFVAWFFCLIFGYVSIIAPFRQSHEYHVSLHGSQILRQFETFVMVTDLPKSQDEMCIISFCAYLEFREEIGELAEGSHTRVLNFYLEVRKALMNNENDRDQLSSSVARSIASNIRQSPSFIMLLHGSHFSADPAEVSVVEVDEYGQMQRDKGIVLLYYNRSIEVLNGIYADFQRTEPFELIKERLKLNDRLEQNLMYLNMTRSPSTLIAAYN